MSTIESRVFAALVGHLSKLPGRPDIAWSNTIYPTPPAARADVYIVVSYAPNSPVRLFIDPTDEHLHMGVLGLSVMSPLGEGEEVPLALCGAIADHFQAAELQEETTTVDITARPAVAGGYVDGDRWRTPVTISFQTRAV